MKTALWSIVTALLAVGGDGSSLNTPDFAGVENDVEKGMRKLEYFSRAEKSMYTTNCVEKIKRTCSDDHDSYGHGSLIVNFVDVKAPDLKDDCQTLAKLEETLLEFFQTYAVVEGRKIACVVVDEVYPSRHAVAVRLQLTIELPEEDRRRRDLQTCTNEDQILCCSSDAVEGHAIFCAFLGCDPDLCQSGWRNLRRRETSACPYVKEKGLASIMSCDGVDHVFSQASQTGGGTVDAFLSTSATLAVMTTDDIYVGCECKMAKFDEDCDSYERLGCGNMGDDLMDSEGKCD